MSIEIRLDEWAPLDGSLPTEPNDDTVYVVPTRPIIDGKIDKYPLYTDHVRYLPKAARAESAPVTFSIPEGGRNFISEFSADVETWQLALAVATILNDWLIFTVGMYIGSRAKSRGDTIEQAEKLPLRVTVAETDKKGRPLRTFTVEGAGDEVIEALRQLQAQERKSWEK